MLATMTSLLITFALAPWFIRRARARQLGEIIRDDGPSTHAAKQGTPTMGGALIIMALVTGTVLWCDLTSPLVWPALFVTVGYGALGFVDDYLKITRKNKRGVPGKLKLLVQFLVGAVAVGWLFFGDALDPSVRQRLAIPLLNFERHSPEIPAIAYAIFGLVLVVMATSNAVNFTDGLDGLAIGPMIASAFTFLSLSYTAGPTIAGFSIAQYLGIAHYAARASWPCSARPWSAPAWLPLVQHLPSPGLHGRRGRARPGRGSRVCGAGDQDRAVGAGHSRRLRGGAVCEVIQVGYFKATGKRIFLMAPIHHHFEKMGWPESRIVVRFWIVSFSCAVLGLLLTLKVR